MQFLNQTACPALAYDSIDQHGQTFHVFILRQTFRLSANGLVRADKQEPLCVADTFFGAANASSVRQESDFCPYKPRCDVIVNASAHAPQGKPSRRFQVRLEVRRPDTPAPLPDEPRGLNPRMYPSDQSIQEWRRLVNHAEQHPLAGERLIDKTLLVTGERAFRRHLWPIRLLFTLVKWGTLGIVRLTPWRMTRPQRFTCVALRYELAFGGQSRIDAGSTPKKRIKRIGKQARLSTDQLDAHPDADAPPDARPLAHCMYEPNPVGCGFTQRWYLRATGCKTLPAPRMEYPRSPTSARRFWRAAHGKWVHEAAGLGAIGRAWMPRRALIGQVDAKTNWNSDELPRLPGTFQHAYWNAAPADQQCAHLRGDEVVTLTNLCTPVHAAATADPRGQTVLQFQLPGALAYLALADGAGQFAVQPLVIDTLVIDPDGNCVLVWRCQIAAVAGLTHARLRLAATGDEQARAAALSA